MTSGGAEKKGSRGEREQGRKRAEMALPLSLSPFHPFF
jgi:hypothetical protein